MCFEWNVNYLELDIITMPKFLDSNPLKDTNPETLKKLQNAPKDEFGVNLSKPNLQ